MAPRGVVPQVAVTMTTSTRGAVIRYTLDGSTPTAASPVYSQGLVLSTTGAVVTAVAFAPTLDPSAPVTSAVFVVKAAAPVLSPSAGSFDGSVLVYITSATAAAAIRCTLDGTAPTPQTPVCTSPVVVQTTGTVVSAVATGPGLACSDTTTTSSALVVRTLPVAFTPSGGTYTNQVSVALASPTPGARIYYTSDGSAPTAASTLYSGPVTVSQTGVVLQAVALSAGRAPSSVAASGAFGVLASAPTFSASGTPWDKGPRPGQLGFVEGATVTITCATPGAQVCGSARVGLAGQPLL